MEKKYITDNPNLIAEWNYEKNIDLDPSKLTLGSSKKVWWKCQKGHEWQAVVSSRNKGSGCPYCSGYCAVKGENDLQTVNPNLAKEWNDNKNIGLTPSDVLPNSNKKVWWICSNGHEWQSNIDHRNRGAGCPYCASKSVLEGYNDLKTVNPSLANEWNYEKNNGLTPTNVLPNSNKKVWWICKKGHEWEATINHRNNGRNCPYCVGKKVINGETDLLTTNPTLANEWNYEKNNSLLPTDVSQGSDKKVWWKCEKGHEWQATIYSRSNGIGCPICNLEHNSSFPEYAIFFYFKQHGVEAIHSYKENGYELDVFVPSKKIAVEYDGGFWHKSRNKEDLEKNAKCKNDGIKLYRIREGLPSLNDSSIDLIIQKKQQELEQAIKRILYDLSIENIDINIERDCIVIENLREYTEKENSLLYTNPNLVNEWNHKKNSKLKPENFSPNSDKKVWWKCSKGHEWQSTISSRNRGRGCPYCSSKRILKGYNDLQTVNLTLASEWNHERNGKLKPENFSANSSKKVWWKCNKGHEWQAVISSRNKGAGCPYCSGYYAVKGKTDLQTVNPSLAKEWNYEKNNILTPMDVKPYSNKKVWWKCEKGHEWEATICSRNSGNGCPYCANQKVLPGYNDLVTLNPKLATEWNYEKNNGLKPIDVMPYSGKKVWWKCNKGHEWEATISDRTSGRGCPYCSGQRVLKGYNDLQTINPRLANEWNYEKNNDLTPADVLPNSNKKVWWKCSFGHEWQATINHRNHGRNCPQCYKARRKKSSSD